MTSQKSRSEATKRKLIESAEALFCEKGFEKTAVREIVKAAGVAQGTFYLYFETKEEILHKIIEGVLGTFNEYISLLDIEDPKIEDIDKIIDTMVFYMEENPQIMKLLHSANILEIINFTGGQDTEWFLVSTVEKWLKNATDKKLIGNKSPELYSKLIFQTSHQLLESAFLYNYPDEINVVKEELKVIVRDILR
ncbi:TetR/AcrR family transcriptional regulator [Alkaliphilus peptidifermentans]|uniref:Transcriptional regulator, TetR family n=1 Tax=Alkaliphilus peptidifermentans DSM 18978 TaxID=1120976 RepID=A0A1G5FWL4_9FIRM|nr:TetR/AcrR family transcriptional regulator [Alkaliphilus peptidifermentans]SCY43725.1 transcriptional regulator, TetR family [Alkaliphilus peptidifermentans DSM 18978]